MWDEGRIGSYEELRTLYRQPSEIAANKDRATLDAASRQFVERARFMLLGTHGSDGGDVSPRGGPSGFVRVLDESHLAIADLGGNNRLDTIENIVATNQIGILLVHPGRSETVRLNGRAWVSRDPDLLARFPLPRTPVTAIGVEVVGTFIHCAKAFMRSGMWDPELWSTFADAPDGADILACQSGGAFEAQLVRADLDQGYAEALAYERGN